MLNGISPAVGPERPKTLREMGQGGGIAALGAPFPAHSANPRALRAAALGGGAAKHGGAILRKGATPCV